MRELNIIFFFKVVQPYFLRRREGEKVQGRTPYFVSCVCLLVLYMCASVAHLEEVGSGMQEIYLIGKQYWHEFPRGLVKHCRNRLNSWLPDQVSERTEKLSEWNKWKTKWRINWFFAALLYKVNILNVSFLISVISVFTTYTA